MGITPEFSRAAAEDICFKAQSAGATRRAVDAGGRGRAELGAATLISLRLKSVRPHMSDTVRYVVPVHFPCALRFGRASAPMIPQHVHTICGRKARTSTGPRYPVTFLAFKRRLAYGGGRGGVTLACRFTFRNISTARTPNLPNHWRRRRRPTASRCWRPR